MTCLSPPMSAFRLTAPKLRRLFRCHTSGSTEPLPLDQRDDNPGMGTGSRRNDCAHPAFFGPAQAAANRPTDELGTDETCVAWHGNAASLRSVLIQRAEKPPWHGGHADMLRELIFALSGDRRGA